MNRTGLDPDWTTWVLILMIDTACFLWLVVIPMMQR